MPINIQLSLAFSRPPLSQVGSIAPLYILLWVNDLVNFWYAQRAYWELVSRGKNIFCKKADVG